MKELFGSITSKLTGVFILVFIALVWYSFETTKKLNEAKQKSETLETTISDMNQKMERFEIQINDSTRLHAATVKNLRMTADNIQAKYDELLKASSIKKKDVNSVAVIGTEARDTVYVPTLVDSFGGLQTGYKDQFIDISVNINPERLATIAYASRDSLSLIVNQKKHSILFGLIKWKSLEKTTVINHNPNATISSLQTINVIE
jgi:cbb3-type cytochrome oxidase subunit 3